MIKMFVHRIHKNLYGSPLGLCNNCCCLVKSSVIPAKAGIHVLLEVKIHLIEQPPSHTKLFYMKRT